MNNVPLQTSKLYLDTYQKLLNFSGQFILLQPRWFNVSKLYPEFYKIIEQNYKIVEEVNINNTVYLLYQRN